MLGRVSKEGEEGFHSGMTEPPSGQHTSFEHERCLAGVEPLWSEYHASRF